MCDYIWEAACESIQADANIKKSFALCFVNVPRKVFPPVPRCVWLAAFDFDCDVGSDSNCDAVCDLNVVL